MFITTETIEEIIIAVLKSGSITMNSLISEVQKIKNVTPQAIYKASKKLQKKEIIVKNKKLVGLSHVWISKIIYLLEDAKEKYQSSDEKNIGTVIFSKDTKLAYNFKTFESTDIFWGHIFQILMEVVSTEFPLFVYQAHGWFLLTRTENEIFIWNEIKKSGRQLMILVGGTTPLDIQSKKYFTGSNRYFACPDKLFPKRNYYVNVFDDFIIEVWLDHKISERIDNFYNTTTTFNDIEREKLLDITRAKGRNKLVISRNKAKADKLRKVFKKYFVF